MILPQGEVAMPRLAFSGFFTSRGTVVMRLNKAEHPMHDPEFDDPTQKGPSKGKASNRFGIRSGITAKARAAEAKIKADAAETKAKVAKAKADEAQALVTELRLAKARAAKTKTKAADAQYVADEAHAEAARAQLHVANLVAAVGHNKDDDLVLLKHLPSMVAATFERMLPFLPFLFILLLLAVLALATMTSGQAVQK